MEALLFIVIGCFAVFAVLRLITGFLSRGINAPKQPAERPKSPLDEELGDESVFLVETFMNDGAEDDEDIDEEILEPETPEDNDLEDEEEEFF